MLRQMLLNLLAKLLGDVPSPMIRRSKILELVTDAPGLAIYNRVMHRASARTYDGVLLTCDVYLVRFIGFDSREEIRSVDGRHNERTALRASRL